MRGLDENYYNEIDESRKKWQDIQREYFNKSVNLFLTISIGLMGFVFASFKDFPVDYKFVWLLRFGLISLGLSAISGMILSYAKCREYHYTFRYFMGTTNQLKDEIKESTWGINFWGYKLRYSFEIQVLCMFIGIVLLAIYFACSRHIW